MAHYKADTIKTFLLDVEGARGGPGGAGGGVEVKN
jgi:hypothetical protein